MALSLVGIQMTVALPFVLCTLFIGQIKNPLPLAVFGLTSTFINVSFVSFILGIQETLGVKVSKLYVDQKYAKMSVIFWRTILIGFVLVLFFSFLAYHSKRILIIMQIEEILAQRTSQLLIYCIPYILLQAMNQILENYLSSQGQAKPLIYINTISIFNVIIFGYIFFVILDLEEFGFAYTKLVQEGSNFCVFIYLSKNYLNQETLKFPELKNIFFNLKTFLKESFINILSYSGETINFEINTYLAALLHDIRELNVWVTITNYSILYYCSSIGLGFAVRNLVGHQIGTNNLIQAKKDSLVYLFYILIAAIILIVLQNVFRENIAHIYTKNDFILPKLVESISIFSIVIFPTLSLYALSSMLRLLQLNHFQFLFNVIGYPICGFVFSFLFCYGFGMMAHGLVLGFGIGKLTIISVFIYKLFFQLDWETKLISKEYSQELIDKSLN